MKSFKEIYKNSILTEENNQITKDFLKHVVSSSGGRFSDASNSNKVIIRIPSGMKNTEIISVFKTALSKIKNEYDDIKNFSSIVFKEKGRKSSGSDGYPAIIGGDAPDKGFSPYGDGFRIYITDKDDGGDGGGGGKPKAADYEAAICVEYNVRSLGKSLRKPREEVLKEAMEIAFQKNSDKIEKYMKKANPYSKSETPLTKTAKAVSKDLSGPTYFVHSGTGIGNSGNHYGGGSDTTPKSDIVGTDDKKKFPREYRYSLKKLGDSGEGAQLMSGKKEESKGIFKASWDSWKVGANSKQGIVSIMNAMENKLTGNIEISSGVSAIKKRLKKWLFEGDQSGDIIKKVKENLPGKVYATNSRREWVVKDKNTIRDEDIQKYIKAIFSLMGLLDETRKFENNIFHEVVGNREKSKRGEMIDVVTGKKYTLVISLGGKNTSKTAQLHELFKMTIAQNEVEEVKKILDASLKGKELREDIANFIKNNENIKRHIVFEAGSGWYKFTGKEHPTTEKGNISQGRDPGSPAVADSIMGFSDSKLGDVIPMYTYANENFNLVNQIYVAFKGSGDVRYTSVRMPTESVQNTSSLDTLIEKTISSHFDILYHDLLMESLWGKIQDYAVGAWQKTKQVAASVVQYGRMVLNNILDFSKRLLKAALESVKNIFNELYTMLSQGISQFLDFVGLGEPEGDFTISG